MIIRADQALFLEANTGLDGEPSERPGVLEIAGVVARIGGNVGRGVVAARKIQNDGRGTRRSFVLAGECRASDCLAGCRAKFRQIGKLEGCARVSVDVVVDIVFKLVAVSDVMAAPQAEDVVA